MPLFEEIIFSQRLDQIKEQATWGESILGRRSKCKDSDVLCEAEGRERYHIMQRSENFRFYS